MTDEDGTFSHYNCQAPRGYRLWKARSQTDEQGTETYSMPTSRDKRSVVEGGDFVPDGLAIKAKDLGMEDGKHKFYLEAIPKLLGDGGDWSLPAAELIKVKAQFEDHQEVTWIEKVYVTPVQVDIDIDSDNNDGFDAPGRTLKEDAIENTLKHKNKHPGKILVVNNDDTDAEEDARRLRLTNVYVKDGIPDWADGFNRYTTFLGDELSEGDKFVPVVIAISSSLTPADASIRFSYEQSDPSQKLIKGGTGTKVDPYIYKSADDLKGGSLRLWTRQANVARDPKSIADGGHFIPANKVLKWSSLTSSRKKTIYVEAIKPSDIAALQIRVEVDPDGPDGTAGWICLDSIRVTSQKYAVEIIKYHTVDNDIKKDNPLFLKLKIHWPWEQNLNMKRPDKFACLNKGTEFKIKCTPFNAPSLPAKLYLNNANSPWKNIEIFKGDLTGGEHKIIVNKVYEDISYRYQKLICKWGDYSDNSKDEFWLLHTGVIRGKGRERLTMIDVLKEQEGYIKVKENLQDLMTKIAANKLGTGKYIGPVVISSLEGAFTAKLKKINWIKDEKITRERVADPLLWCDHDCPVHDHERDDAKVCFACTNKEEYEYSKSLDIYNKKIDPIRELVGKAMGKYLPSAKIKSLKKKLDDFLVNVKRIRDQTNSSFNTAERQIRRISKELANFTGTDEHHKELEKSLAAARKTKNEINKYLDKFLKYVKELQAIVQKVADLEDGLVGWTSGNVKKVAGLDLGLKNSSYMNLKLKPVTYQDKNRCYVIDNWLAVGNVQGNPATARRGNGDTVGAGGNIIPGNKRTKCKDTYEFPSSSKGYLHMAILQEIMDLVKKLKGIPGINKKWFSFDFNMYYGTLTEAKARLDFSWEAGQPLTRHGQSEQVEDFSPQRRKCKLHRLRDDLKFNGSVYAAMVNIGRHVVGGKVRYFYTGEVFFLIKDGEGWDWNSLPIDYSKKTLDKRIDFRENNIIKRIRNMVKFKREESFFNYINDMSESYQ